ncbi:hypothetical protein SESBI_34947 [Sesbania bispinosa]|nr:hypothetical protein SESBI_34947 [Sesbania bispinosa]
MAYIDNSNLCRHLTLETTDSGSSRKKRKHDDKPISSRKKACNEVERRWGYSTELVLYNDLWSIKKVLKESDLSNISRLLLGRDLA